MISRAFFAESAPLRRLSPLQKQKTRYLCNFFAITDSSLLLQARKRPFLLRFGAAIRVLAPRDNPQSQKSCNPSRFFVSGFLGRPRNSAGALQARYGTGDALDTGRGGPDTALGCCLSATSGAAQVRHRDVAPLPRSGTVWAWCRDVTRAWRCEARVALRAWAPARISCCVIAFS